jgi:hypothetical protein
MMEATRSSPIPYHPETDPAGPPSGFLLSATEPDGDIGLDNGRDNRVSSWLSLPFFLPRFSRSLVIVARPGTRRSSDRYREAGACSSRLTVMSETPHPTEWCVLSIPSSPSPEPSEETTCSGTVIDWMLGRVARNLPPVGSGVSAGGRQSLLAGFPGDPARRKGRIGARPSGRGRRSVNDVSSIVEIREPTAAAR